MTATIKLIDKTYHVKLYLDDSRYAGYAEFDTAQQAFESLPEGTKTEVSIQPASKAGKELVE